jgi:hypothetical protein
MPMTRDTSRTLAVSPPGVDRTLWLYELCRFLIAQCNSLLVGFLFDTPPCSATTCPEMRASEWQFLCAVHDAPKSCCAIDYCCHTLDWAANVVTNPKIFPSRFVVAADAHDRNNAAAKNLVNVFRRLHRVFAHAWFQHRGVFWSVETHAGLYVFFKTVCDVYDLLPAENYKLPPEAEGLEGENAIEDARTSPPSQNHAQGPQSSTFAPTTIAKMPVRGAGIDGSGGDDDEAFNPVGRTNTRRHIRSSPSTGSAVATVLEADENIEGLGVSLVDRTKGLHISSVPPETVPEEEPEPEPETGMDVPVIVEHTILDPPQQQHQPPSRPSSVAPPAEKEKENGDHQQAPVVPQPDELLADEKEEAAVESAHEEDSSEEPVILADMPELEPSMQADEAVLPPVEAEVADAEESSAPTTTTPAAAASETSEPAQTSPSAAVTTSPEVFAVLPTETTVSASEESPATTPAETVPSASEADAAHETAEESKTSE